MVAVDFHGPTYQSLGTPSRERNDGIGVRIWSHSFCIPGVRFILAVGSALTLPHFSRVTPQDRIAFYEWNPDETGYIQGLITHMQGVQPKGKLAKLYA